MPEVIAQFTAAKGNARFGVWAMVFAGLLPAATAGAMSPRFTTDFPLNRSIGPLRAGKLCLPKGSVAASQFISDTKQFDLLVRQMLDEQAEPDRALLGTSSEPRIEVHLKAAAVRLCAKSWGVFGTGDTKALSGKADFTFAWKKDGQAALAVETVALEVNGKDRLTAPAILRRAVTVLLKRLAASNP